MRGALPRWAPAGRTTVSADMARRNRQTNSRLPRSSQNGVPQILPLLRAHNERSPRPAEDEPEACK
ncbi:MAG: hypothetical protein DWQ41_16205 [Planctomycetota bacterium]|nr:MAG: hypothetical protein DWQ41_16205 [Planctomycetota bacterium]